MKKTLFVLFPDIQIWKINYLLITVNLLSNPAQVRISIKFKNNSNKII